MIETTKGAVPRKRPMTEKQRAEELSLLKGEGPMWSTWPVCHVKRPMTEGWPEMGAILVGNPVIYDFSVWSGTKLDPSKKIATYSSFEEMLDDGWIVD